MTINKKKMVMMIMIMKVSIGWATILPQPPRSNPRGEWRYHRDLSKNDDDCNDYDNGFDNYILEAILWDPIICCLKGGYSVG